MPNSLRRVAWPFSHGIGSGVGESPGLQLCALARSDMEGYQNNTIQRLDNQKIICDTLSVADGHRRT